MEKKCRNCLLYSNGVCNVTVIIAGERYELPVLPDDDCHWERLDQEINQDLDFAMSRPGFRPNLDEERDVSIEVKQIRVWSDGHNGYIESPAD